MRCWLAQHWDFRTTCQDFFGVYGAILGRDLSGITPWFCVWGDYVTKSRSLFLVASGPDEAEDWQLVNRRDELDVPTVAFPAFNWGPARAGMELTAAADPRSKRGTMAALLQHTVRVLASPQVDVLPVVRPSPAEWQATSL